MLRENIQDSEDLALLTTVEKSASRGAALVKQILGFAHGIGGEPVVVQVRHLVNDVAAIIRETFPKNIRLELQIDQDPWTITGNPTQIHQVLLNLCVNARDAMPEGGSLRLRCENCVFDERAAMAIKGARAGPWLVLDVEDTGTGMEPAVQAHIWEPFFTTKTADKGTGLGLSTVRGIVETHHGFIALASQPGQGTRFRVFLPATGGEAGVENPIPAAPRGGGEFILVVDDEATIREMVKAIVSSHGYRVLAAVDGIEAIAMLAPRTGEIDIVVADMLMPRLGGRPLIDVIRRLNPSVKLLAMSGSHEGWDAVEGRGSRADSFIMKPFTGEELLTKIHSLLHPGAAPGA
jgi:CheY-like chemotaxis protein